MKISKYGIKKLIEFEGFKNQRYEDAAGKWTIGVGHLLLDAELATNKIYLSANTLDIRDGLNEQEVRLLLSHDITRFEQAVSSSVKVALTPSQFDTLVIFAFNVGVAAFKSSTLLKVLNDGDYNDVPTQLLRWTYANGNSIQGLINRRNKEIAMWNSAVEPVASLETQELDIMRSKFRRIKDILES